MRQKLLAQIETYRDYAVELMADLTAIPALGPTNNGTGEMEKALYLTKILENLGLTIERADAPDERVPGGLRPNILAWRPGGKGPGCYVLTHMDVVPEGSLSLWDSDPWRLKVEGSKLYGRGTSDNHDAMVASLLALKAIMELDAPLPGPAGVSLVSDEETGSLMGLDYVLKARPDFFKKEDIIIVPDSGNSKGTFIEIAEKSILWLRVEVTGKQAHASVPQMGRNALYAAARMMTAIYEVRDSLGMHNQLFRPPITTMEPTRKEAGVSNINTIPGSDVFYIDCRVLPETPLAELEAGLTSAFDAIAAELGVCYSMTREQALQAPPATAPDAPVVEALKGAIYQVNGQEAHVGGIGGGTVAAFFRQRGLSAAVWNTNHCNAHTPNEWADINDIINDAKVFALIYAGLHRPA